MTDIPFNRRAFGVCLWIFAGLCLLVILTSCTPMPTAQAAPVATDPGTIVPTIAAIATPKPSQTPAPLCADVTALEALHVRSGPGTQSQVIAYLAHGDQVTVIDQAAQWWQIRTAQGLTGWANSNYLKPTTCGG